MNKFFRISILLCLTAVILLTVVACKTTPDEKLEQTTPEQTTTNHVHTVVIDAAVAPTATEDGLTEGKHCSTCGEVIVLQETISALGTPGLAYVVNEDGETCTITGIGTCTDSVIRIGNYIDGYRVTVIGNKAFRRCTSLTSVTIGDSVTDIGDNAFSYCTSLTNLLIPNSVTTIGNAAFSDCTNLTSIIVDENNPAYQSIDGNLYSKDGTTLVMYASGNPSTNFTIPKFVTAVGDCAFSGCTNLTSLTIGNNITSIGFAFPNCVNLTDVYIYDIASWCNISFAGSHSNPLCYAKNLYLVENGIAKLVTNLVIPDSVTTIGSRAFSNYMHLDSVTIPNSVTTIGSGAFSGCENLQNVTIPESVTMIGGNAFSDCNHLENVYIYDIAAWCNISFTFSNSNPLHYAKNLYFVENNTPKLITDLLIPHSVTTIGDFVFSNCTSLMNVTIPDSVTTIGDLAFSGCASLINVTIPNSVTVIGNSAFSGCISLTDVTISSSLKIINVLAFSDCVSLTNVIIPDSVSMIETFAFAGCASLISVTIPDSVNTIGTWPFASCPNLSTIIFRGTVEQWNAISKDPDWNLDIPATEVICSDGVVSLK